MLKLARTLAESEPAKAERLRDALKAQGERDVARRLSRIVDLMKQGELGDADAVQVEVLADLNAVLALLGDSSNEIDAKREARERLVALRRAVEQLRDSQLQTLYKTQQAQRQRELAAKLAQQAEALEELNKKQQEAIKPDELSDAAKEARQRAAELGELRDAAPDERSDAALREAEQSVQQAVGEMEQSAVQAGDAAQGSEAREKAAKNLERAIRRLRDESRRLEKQAALNEIERKQREIEQEARGVEDEARKGAEKSAAPSSAQKIAKARQRMQDAADRLGEQDAKQAEASEQEALADLQETVDELEDALRQVREEELEETLGALELRLRALLAGEERIREELAPFSTGGGEFSREARVAVIGVGQRQGALVKDADAVQRLLVQEGTTVILPELFGEVIGQMKAAEARLAEADAGPSTRRAVEGSIVGLREILGAVERRREEMAQQKQQGQQGGQSAAANPALLQSSAELKLLKAAQSRVNAETLELSSTPREAAGAEFQALAERQSRLVKMSKRMHEKR